MTIVLVTVPNVPIVSTGTYQLASGETTFTAEMLQDAVAAASDATIVSPRLKLGHSDPRFAEAVASGELDGEPAFGTVENLRLSEDGQTILGDYNNVPEWLAESLPSSYPGRSIEGGWNVTAASGRTYRLVITACALLGVTWPGVTSLADLQEVLEQNGAAPEQIAADGGEFQGGRAERFVVARIAQVGEPRQDHGTVEAGIDVGDARMMLMADVDNGACPTIPDGAPGGPVGPQIWWWPRSIRIDDDGGLSFIIDDDEGHLIQLPFTVNGADLSYGDPTVVMVQYVPVAASAPASDGPRVIASWPVRAASRPSNSTEVHLMDVDAAVLRTRLGLADDADDAAILAALATAPAPAPETTPVVAAAETTPTTIPEGMALVDAETLATLRTGAQAGLDVAARQARDDRDRVIQAAIGEGRFPVSRRGHYEQAWDRDPEGTRTLLTASAAEGGLAPGLVPVGAREVGQSGDGEGQPAAIEAQHEEFMARQFPNEHARLRGSGNGRTRIRQEA